MATTGGRDGLSFVPSAVLERAIPCELARLRAVCPLPFTPHLFIFKPGQGIAPHKDGRAAVRQCALITPLHPLTGYAPTLFWQGDEVVHTLPREALPALVDLQTVHSVPAAPALRINFQLAFHVPFAVAAERLAAGALELLRPPRPTAA